MDQLQIWWQGTMETKGITTMTTKDTENEATESKLEHTSERIESLLLLMPETEPLTLTPPEDPLKIPSKHPPDSQKEQERRDQHTNKIQVSQYHKNSHQLPTIPSKANWKIQCLLNGKQELWRPGQRAEDLNKLTRKQTRTIFKAWARMLNVQSS